VRSGFLSVDNPDSTAANLFELMAVANLSRAQIVGWNSVPWALTLDGKGRAASRADLAEGTPYLEQLVALLPNLEAVLLLGRKAQRAGANCRALDGLQVFVAPHPSPIAMNTRPEAREQILAQLQVAAELCRA
jgi:uracil-DNA glycosylase